MTSLIMFNVLIRGRRCSRVDSRRAADEPSGGRMDECSKSVGWSPLAYARGSESLLKPLVGGMAPALVAALLLALPAPAQEPEQTFKFSVTSNLVIVNVGVRDRNGNPVEDLEAEDFEITEDGERQEVSVFEFQRLDEDDRFAAEPAAAEPSEEVFRSHDITPSAPGQVRYQDRRLLVFYFDFSSMPPADQIRAQRSALKFLDEHMTPADLVAIMAFSSRLQVLQDFTDNRELLAEVIGSFRMGEASELAGEAETGEALAVDDGSAFVADETEFNIFNTDLKLSALESAANMLSSLPEKKALIYFSSGVGKTGVENHSQVRSAVNAAVRANVAFYPIDTRGLVAEAPLGDTRQGSPRGARAYSGAGQRQRRERFNDQQETLFTLAADTGGKALLNNNDLSVGMVQAQQDVSSYYILGYYSTNSEMDGRFRRVKIRIRSRPKLKLDYRSGYFGPKEFRRFSSTDKERQLEEALLLGDPITDLTLALEVNYFRLARDRYFVPVAVKIPGSEFELARKRGHEQTRIDFIGQVRDGRRKLVASLRDQVEVKLRGADAERLAGRRLQYDTGFTLPPGRYQIKFLTRENQSGKIGTFETEFAIPDIDAQKDYARLSSVVWSNQREPLDSAVGVAERDRKLLARHPLVRDGRKLIPSITRVFRNDQNLYVYFEMYDPSVKGETKAPSVAASVSFFREGRKTFETEPFRAVELAPQRRRTVPIEFQVPLGELSPGEYVCQVNAVDEFGRKFAFRRAPLVVLP